MCLDLLQLIITPNDKAYNEWSLLFGVFKTFFSKYLTRWSNIIFFFRLSGVEAKSLLTEFICAWAPKAAKYWIWFSYNLKPLKKNESVHVWMVNYEVLHLQIGVYLLINSNNTAKSLSKYLRFMCCTFRVASWFFQLYVCSLSFFLWLLCCFYLVAS